MSDIWGENSLTFMIPIYSTTVLYDIKLQHYTVTRKEILSIKSST